MAHRDKNRHRGASQRPAEHWLAGGHHRKNQGCCSYERAGDALVRGKGRLAVRYIRMDIKARMGLIGSRRMGTVA